MYNEKLDVPSEYVAAKDECQKAYSALSIARRKQSIAQAWEWAVVAARHAENIGISNARELLGTGSYPEFPALDAAISSRRKDELIIVTRHKGLVEWLNARGYAGRVIARATPMDVLNKHVIGKLPIHLSAVCASVTNVSIPGVPEDRWGNELTSDDLDRYGAFMRTYVVKEITVIEPI